MYKIIEEGKAKIKVKKSPKISKDMEVFYNPVMKTNRDISILIINCINKKGMGIGLPLAGTGIRGIRFLLEIGKSKIKHITINDYDKEAVKAIKNNLKLNKISIKNKKIQIINNDANLLLLNSTGFDYIDIDPFGSPNPFLDSAVKRISRGGILAVTATDTAALTGTYPKVSERKYWAKITKNENMHELGLRILTRKVQLVGAQFDKALIPIFSYFKDHYFRIFFKCLKGKKDVDNIIRDHGIINNIGPLWLGQLWDKKIANKIHRMAVDSELKKFLEIIKDESKIDIIGFYNIHKLVKKNKIKGIIKKEKLIQIVKNRGYKASATHFSPISIKSEIPIEKLIPILRKF